MARFTTKQGFTLSEMVVSIGVSAVIILIASALFLQLYQQKERADFLLTLSDQRASLQNAVVSAQAWAQSEAADPMMACFSGPTPSSCSALVGMAPRDLKLYSGTTIFYDSTNPAIGFTKNGASCSTYGSTPECILKPHATWQAQCNLTIDPTCLSPLILVDIKFTYSGTTFSSINFNAYGLHLAKAQFSVPAVNACTGALPICTASQAGVCEAGTWVCREFGL